MIWIYIILLTKERTIINTEGFTMDKIKTFAPIFNGFYETPFEINDDDVHNELVEDLTYSDDVKDLLSSFIYDNWSDCINIQYDEFESDSARAVCDFLTDKLYSVLNDESIKVEYEKVVSPKYYNFRNDSIDVVIKCGNVNSFINELKKIIKSNIEKFETYIKEHYTSYDGFMSFYSNDYNDWFKDAYDEHEIGALIDFVLKLKCPNIYDEMIYFVKENVYDMYYVDLTDKIKSMLTENEFDSIFKECDNAYKQKNEYVALMKNSNKEINNEYIYSSEVKFKKQLLEDMKAIFQNY